MKKVLVIDDDMINRKLLKNVVSKAGDYEVIEAENGQEGLSIIENTKIDLILLDIVMPVMDGIDLLKILKNDSNFSKIPVAILTTDDSRRNEAISLGATEVLIKPIKREDIINILNSSF